MIDSKEKLTQTRRTFLGASSGVALSAGALALLGGMRASGAKAASPENDVAVLNAALGAEQEAIAAYKLGAESGLLSAGTLGVATKFKEHHEAHAGALTVTIETLGGVPVEPADAYTFPVEKLTSEKAVLEFAAGLEEGAVSAYLDAVPVFDDRDLARVAASILGDEAMHWAVLRNALGLDPVPVAFVY